MKLYIYDHLDNYGKPKYQVLELDDVEAENWVTVDFERRQAEAKEGEVVEKRTAQQIQDEIDKDFYNSDRREFRHRAAYDTLEDEEGNEISIIDTIASDEETPEEVLIRKEQEEQAYEKLNILSETQRRRYLMRHRDGMTLKEIAEKEGKDISSIKESLDAAEKKLN